MQAVGARPTLRALEARDATQLAALSAALGGAETVDDWLRLLARGEAALGVALGADAGGKLVGYAAGEVRRSFGLGEAAGWVESFGVDLEWRGHGLGRSLLAALLARFRELGATRVCTLVPLHDRALGPFFREVGFREEALSCLGRKL